MITRLAITGYKAHELGIFSNTHEGVQYIKKAFRKRIEQLIDQGLEWIIISGQLGVELWVAEEVIELRDEYPDLQLAIMTPYLDQQEKWNDNNKEYYEYILSEADFVASITNRKYEKPWQLKAKTEFLLNKTDALLVLYDAEKEGTPKYMVEDALKYSRQTGYQVITITPYDIQDIIDEERYNSYE